MNHVWKKELIETEKTAVKSSLDQYEDPRTRLNQALKEISKLKEEMGSLSRVRCYVYCISALVHHARMGGLSDFQIKQLSQIAQAVLKIEGIRTSSRSLSYLYGDLHLVLSQVYRRQGQHWRATWEQQVAEQLSAKSSEDAEAFLQLSLGLRMMRQGFATLAVESYDKALEANVLSTKSALQAQLGRIKALRLAGKLELCETRIRSLDASRLEPDHQKELLWESLCLEVAQTGEIGKLVQSIRPRQALHDYTYIDETFVWTRIIQSRDYLSEFPSARSLAWNPRLKPDKKSLFHRFVVVLEGCYDYAIPLDIRMERLGDLLAQSFKLISIEKEILVWAAATRWLARTKAYSLAATSLGEYQSLCLRLSNGESRDVLNVMGDLYEKAWAKALAGSRPPAVLKAA